MDDENAYDFASFGADTDLYQKVSNSSTASSDAYSYFKRPSYFSVTQLTDLLSTSSRNTSNNSKNAAEAKPKDTSQILTATEKSTPVPAPPAPLRPSPSASANIVMSVHSRPASGVSSSYLESEDSIARIGRNFLTQTTSVPSSRRSLFTTATGEGSKPSSPAGSERQLFSMPAIHVTSGSHQRPSQRPTAAESNPQLPTVSSNSPTPLSALEAVPKKHRNSAPATTPVPPHEQQPQHGRNKGSAKTSTRGLDGAAQAESRFEVNSAPSPNVSNVLTSLRNGEPRRPADAAPAAGTRPRLTPAAASHPTSAHAPAPREDAAMQRAVTLASAAAPRSDGSGREPKIHFYNVAHASSPGGSSLKGEDVKPTGPTMRAATIQWDDDSDTDGSPAALTYVSNPAEQGTIEAEHHVQVVIVKAASETEPVASRPPPLDARRTYDTTPELCPLASPSTTTYESSRSARHSSISLSYSDSRDNFTADEVVDVGYASGSAIRTSLIADSLRVHFLSGHNTMLTIANTPQCTALAEDAVSTMIQTVFQQSDLMSDDFRNELSLSAHAIYPDGMLYNLLPTTTDTQHKTEIQVGANPVMGTCIVNNAPVNMWSMDEATFLSRAVIQNARHLRADPYSDPSALVHVTVLLRQIRTSQHPETEMALHDSPASSSQRHSAPPSPHSRSTGSGIAEVNPTDMHVYLSSLHILWVGHNFPVVHHLLTDQPANMWPLYRQAFGGQCCTAVMSFVDRTDDLLYSKSTLEFSEYMRGFVNRPPRSGSVQKFLTLTEKAANEELDRNILSLEKMRRDALRLLKDPAAEPCLYAVTPRNELSQEPYIGAYRVVLIPSLSSPSPHSVERERSHLSTNTPPQNNHHSSADSPSNSSSRRGSAPTAPMSLTQIPRSDRQSAASSFTGSEININMPSFIRQQEKAAAAARKSSTPLSVTSQTLPPSNEAQQRALAVGPPAPPPRKSSLSATTTSTHSRDAHVRNGRQRAAGVEPPSASGTAAESQLSTASSYGECIKTNLLVFSGVLDSPSYAAPRTDTFAPTEPVVSRLPLKVSDPHTLYLAPAPAAPAAAAAANGDNTPTKAAQRASSSAPACFEIDEIKGARFDNRTQTYNLLGQFAAVRDVCNTFLDEESNVALLYTHGSATARPFQQLPVWEVVDSVIHKVVDIQRDLPMPAQFTLFGSMLKGTTIVRDLAEVGLQDAEQPADGQEALVGASPIFGSILYQTRGVDICTEAEIKPVMHSMLSYADKEAGLDPDMYILLTAVRKTTSRLPLAEAPDRLPEYTYDANFCSFTVVVTRNMMDVFQNAVVEMNAVVGSARPAFPFGLMSEAIGGSCKTVHLLSLEAANTPVPLAAKLLETQRMLSQVQNEARRSNRISVYVRACLTASRALEAAIERSQNPNASMDSSQEMSPADEKMAQAHVTKLQALAEQHADYLRDPNVRGFVIYPTLTIEDMQTLFFNSFRYGTNSSGQLQAKASAMTGSVSGATPHQSLTPSALLRQHQKEQQQQQQQQQQVQQQQHASPGASDSRAVEVHDDLPPSAINAHGEVANKAAKRPVSAVALSRDSGIVAHSLLLVLQSNLAGSASSRGSKRTCHLTTSKTNEVTVNYGPSMSVYAFDEIVEVSAAPGAAQVSATRNSGAFMESSLLHDALAGCLAGYNATMVLQETVRAQEKGVCESVFQHVCRSTIDACPKEAAFFMSISYLDDQSCVDLLDKEAVDTAIRLPGTEGRCVPQVGKSPLIGVFLASAELRLMRTSRDVSEAITTAFRADDAISATADAPPHFLVISLWQKLHITSEQDVSLSSLLLIVTRGGPHVLQSALSRTTNDTIAQLLRYALRGACYTLCGCAISDAEPQASSSKDPRDAEFEPAMDFYQNNLNAYTGKILRYNSVADALKSHRAELVGIQTRLQQLRQRALSVGEAGLSDAERRDGHAMEMAVQHVQRMIVDEEAVLRETADALTTVPPFYLVNGPAHSTSI